MKAIKRFLKFLAVAGLLFCAAVAWLIYEDNQETKKRRRIGAAQQAAKARDARGMMTVGERDEIIAYCRWLTRTPDRLRSCIEEREAAWLDEYELDRVAEEARLQRQVGER